jgi:hypothetical protein
MAGRRVTPTPVLAARGAAFLLLAALIALAPSARQVFGVRSPYLRSWTMFSGFGLDLCVAEFEGAGGAALDRYAVLDEHRATAPKWLRKLRSEDDVRGVAKRLCAKLGQDVRVTAKCASRSGWKTVIRPKDPVCGRGGAASEAVDAGDDDPREVLE